MTNHAVSSAQAPKALGPYSQGVASGDFLFCSGQIGLDPATGQLVEGIEAQTERVLHNLEAVLEAGGMTFADVVKTTILLANMADYATVNEIYGKTVSDPAPARSTFAALGLPRGALIEIEVIARRRAAS
jgi:2-iminobutanoate/2-iminopropanoate deaminase